MPPPPGSNMQNKPPPALVPTIPPHSLVAFGLFLRLPGYAEVLLKERKRAQCLLRLVLGVTDDGEGGECKCKNPVNLIICCWSVKVYLQL